MSRVLYESAQKANVEKYGNDAQLTQLAEGVGCTPGLCENLTQEERNLIDSIPKPKVGRESRLVCDSPAVVEEPHSFHPVSAAVRRQIETNMSHNLTESL